MTGTLETFDGTPSAITASWPGFRGPIATASGRRCGNAGRAVAGGGPPELWRVEMGEGYAGAAVHQGRVYVIDYDMENQRDAIRCLSLDDGREIWRYSYPVLVRQPRDEPNGAGGQ